ncbi:MAG: hypothetical protein KAY32_01225 [Candidatus Eisenbacteria sp.]|nr:hypothetical protein [Candidatus Eisenbacteria bacterium]
MARSRARRYTAALAAIAFGLPLLAMGLPGCRAPMLGEAGRRPANAALLILASGSLDGKLRAVG